MHILYVGLDINFGEYFINYDPRYPYSILALTLDVKIARGIYFSANVFIPEIDSWGLK